MAENDLISETAWSREFRVGPETFQFESKFVNDDLNVPAETVRNRWPQWGPAEQLSFVTAFILKPEKTATKTKQDKKLKTCNNRIAVGMKISGS